MEREVNLADEKLLRRDEKREAGREEGRHIRNEKSV